MPKQQSPLWLHFSKVKAAVQEASVFKYKIPFIHDMTVYNEIDICFYTHFPNNDFRNYF